MENIKLTNRLGNIRYPKVLQSDILDKLNINKDTIGKFVIEEKYDGSQFRFGYKNGEKTFGSKSVDFNEYRQPDRMFKLAVENADKVLDNIHEENITFFAEYFQSEKHNTLTYDKIPENNLVLFDIYKDGFLPAEEIEKYAKILGISSAKILNYTDRFPDKKLIDKLLTAESSLGGTTIEGVIIKNYSMGIELNNEIRPLFYKYVRPQFKELNKQEWSKHPEKQSIAGLIPLVLNKEAVFRKAVQHLEESGKSTGRMQDMKELIPLVYDDLEKEYKIAIMEALYEKYEKEIRTAIVRGLPEYYKAFLFEKTEREINKKL